MKTTLQKVFMGGASIAAYLFGGYLMYKQDYAHASCILILASSLERNSFD